MNDGHWQMEGSTAEHYQRDLVPAITSKWADDLVGRAQPRATEAVLDVACGTGVVSRVAAEAGAEVTGLDLNAGMLAVARHVRSEGKPINWVEGSALDLPFPAARFDVVLCQLGLQFFPDQGQFCFPSVLDYVRFQLLATPMVILLKGRSEDERLGIIGSVAAKTTARCSPTMLRHGRFVTPQEGYVAVGHCRPGDSQRHFSCNV
jgi:SAM-dependent methyltransferase